VVVGVSGAMVLDGRDAVREFYSGMIAMGGNQFEVVVDKIVADHDNVVTEGQVRSVSTGATLRAGGQTELDGQPIDDDALYLSRTQLSTVWPGDPDGKLVGEDIYMHGETTFEPIRKDELPEGHHLA